MRNIISSPREFFESIVTPDYEAFMANQGNIRLAFHVCMALDHLVDWVIKAKGGDRGDFLSKKYKEFPAIKTIRVLSCNAKHFPPNPKKAPKIDIGASAASLKIDSVAVSIDTIPDWDSYGAGPQVIGRLETGEKLWLVNPITAVYSFWKNEYEQGLW